MKKFLVASLTAMAVLGFTFTGSFADDDDDDNELTVYMAKFVCGDGGFSVALNGGVQTAFYRTAVNIGNPNNKTVNISKQVVFTEFNDGAGGFSDFAGQSPKGPGGSVVDALQPFWAVEWDCAQLGSSGEGGFSKGFLIIKVDGQGTDEALPANVVGVYTAGPKVDQKDGISIDVEQVPGNEIKGDPIIL